MRVIKLDQSKEDGIGLDMDKFLASGQWWISRNGGIDICGEWQPSGSWSGYRNV